MKRAIAILAAFACCSVCPTYADYGVSDEGTWPKSWPKELEPLRKQARTYEGPLYPSFLHYLIPFNKREEFEAAWPHLLKVKTKGAPIFLVHGPKTDFFVVQPAGVLIHAPPANTDKKAHPEAPTNASSPRERWTYTNYIELVVDGDIVDLNRLPLPPDSPIIDERFKNADKK